MLRLRSSLAWLPAFVAACGLLTAPSSACAAAGEADPFARPPELEKDVRFWIRVYTEVTTDQGLLHDDWNLGLVYEVMRFDPGSSPTQRQLRVTDAKSRYAGLLRKFAAGSIGDLTAHEQRILHAFGEHATATDYQDAIDRIRFQLGQADHFHEGLIRAAVWEKLIAKTLVTHGVPAEIAALPHVESSFNVAAYSKVGAAGLWQFMPATARRYMRVDGLVDERLDPYSSTEAAANLMLYNYGLVGTWPLAVTAYNHGPGGLRSIQDELGTSDISVIVKRYHGRTFGFASRNFYVAFLAALEVDCNAERYFGPIIRLPETDSTATELPDYIAVDVLARAFRADLGALRVLNPALRPPIWDGSRLVPRGYKFRLPGAQPPSQLAEGWARLPASQRYLAQRSDGNHKLRRGESLAGVAAAGGISLTRLLAFNGWKNATSAPRGAVVRVPMPASRAERRGNTIDLANTQVPSPASPVLLPIAASGISSVSAATRASLPAPISASVPPPAAVMTTIESPPKEPVSERQTNANALLPAASPTGSPDATIYDFVADDTVIVQAAETLGQFADWTGTDPGKLRTLNKMRSNATVTQGKKLKLDLSQVTAAQFVAARLSYHLHLQQVFFAAHRIAGTETYAVKRGDSLWTIAQQRSAMPLWLVTQYNPDVNFNDVHPGTAITLPQVVAINRQ